MVNARLAPAALGWLFLGPAAAFGQSAAPGDFSGAVDVGGRNIHLECKGEGTPAVMLISGYLDLFAGCPVGFGEAVSGFLNHVPEEPLNHAPASNRAMVDGELI